MILARPFCSRLFNVSVVLLHQAIYFEPKLEVFQLTSKYFQRLKFDKSLRHRVSWESCNNP